MKKISQSIIFFVFCLTTVAGNFFVASPARAALELIKSRNTGTIYYIDSANTRHAFPNLTTYRSWYGTDTSKIVTLNTDVIAQYPLGKNITIRPGTNLVKISSEPQVYAVEQGGVLREIKDEDVAAAIYGKNWAKRVVDIPDVFFDNYSIGQPITADYVIPDGIVLQDPKTKQYFYKNNDLLRPFASSAAMTANHLQVSSAISSNRSFSIRTRPINGFDADVFNPVASPITDSRDCENKKLKAAVLFLADTTYQATELAKVEKIKSSISDKFSWATYNMSNIDASFPTDIILDDGYILKKNNDGTTDINNEVINTFYDKNPDQFDFIFIFTDFKVPSEDTNEIAHFTPVSNRVEGIGKPLLNRASVFGSTGKLKGIILMGNVNKYDTDTETGMNAVMDVVLHELLHNWAAYIAFTAPNGKNSYDLLRAPDEQHWNYYDAFVSPIGGSGWTANGDGTFSSALAAMPDSNVRRYSQLDLYLMGLIPQQVMPPVQYVKPPMPGVIGNIIPGTMQTVTIDQIVNANGPVRCSID